jgi:hypothetical protein
LGHYLARPALSGKHLSLHHYAQQALEQGADYLGQPAANHYLPATEQPFLAAVQGAVNNQVNKAAQNPVQQLRANAPAYTQQAFSIPLGFPGNSASCD